MSIANIQVGLAVDARTGATLVHPTPGLKHVY